MFAGSIWEDPESSVGQLTGQMTHLFGSSKLSRIYISDQSIEFTKAYERRSDLIHFTFRVRKGNLWIGGYKGEKVGNGVSSCIITQVSPQLFDPEFIMKTLDREKVHIWPDEHEA